MLAYKLFREKASGHLGSLFINRRDDIPIGKWMWAGCHPKKGFATRRGWHALPRPLAPHLSSASRRRWYLVDLRHVKEEIRPANQGGRWYLASRMKVIRPATTKELDSAWEHYLYELDQTATLCDWQS